MKLKEAWDNYADHTRRVGELVRQLSFAGIAVIWLFRIEDDGSTRIADDLRLPTLLLVLSLALDFLQAAIGSAVWGVFGRKKELEFGEDYAGDFKRPRQINWPALTLFWAKTAGIVLAYALLLEAIAKRIY